MNTKFHFGKYKGKTIDKAPVEYLNWAIKNCSLLTTDQIAAIHKRLNPEDYSTKNVHFRLKKTEEELLHISGKYRELERNFKKLNKRFERLEEYVNLPLNDSGKKK